jgi:hypothetical protein
MVEQWNVVEPTSRRPKPIIPILQYSNCEGSELSFPYININWKQAYLF